MSPFYGVILAAFKLIGPQQLIFTSPQSDWPEDYKEARDKKFPTFKGLWTLTCFFTFNQLTEGILSISEEMVNHLDSPYTQQVGIWLRGMCPLYDVKKDSTAQLPIQCNEPGLRLCVWCLGLKCLDQ